MGIGNIANTGMRAAMANMETISNNIANANTIGFKRSNVNFSDIYPSASGTSGTQIGLGVNVGSISQDFSTSGFVLTNSGLDLSISKNGFFITKDAIGGQVSYTRAGQFSTSPDGYIISKYSGNRLQGYAASNGVIPQGGGITDLHFNNSSLPAKASTLISTNINLDANSTVPANPFDPSDTSSFNFQSKSFLYDSLGNKHDVISYYSKTANNNWDTHVYIDNNFVGTSGSPTGSIAFNSDGSIASVTGLNNLSFSSTNGADYPQTFSFDFEGSTQVATNSIVNSSESDGYEPGQFSGLSIDNNGMVWMQYSNSQKFLAGQVALANFKAPQGLTDIGNMSWVASSDSGAALLNQSGSVGNIRSNSLEQSNVDLTSEMVSLINAQHTFQANAQVEQTYSEVMSTVIKI